MIPFRRLSALGLALAALLIGAASLSAQESVLRGMIVDTLGRPVPGALIVLHSVSEAGGEALAQDTSDAAGRFELRTDVVADPNTVYFAATIDARGTVYLGEPLRGTFAHTGDYRIEIGRNGIRQAAEEAAPPPPPGGFRADTPTPWALVIGVVGGALLLFYLLRRRGGPRGRRALLLELAALEERYAERQGLAPAEREEYLQRRESLRTRLGAAAAV